MKKEKQKKIEPEEQEKIRRMAAAAIWRYRFRRFKAAHRQE